jgi:hypothetical protein
VVDSQSLKRTVVGAEERAYDGGKKRLRPWFGVAVGLAALVGVLAFGILGRNFGTLEHLMALNDAGSWLTVYLIKASAGILALLLAAVALVERIERGVERPHFISLIRLTARGGFATIAPAVFFDVLLM